MQPHPRFVFLDLSPASPGSHKYLHQVGVRVHQLRTPGSAIQETGLTEGFLPAAAEMSASSRGGKVKDIHLDSPRSNFPALTRAVVYNQNLAGLILGGNNREAFRVIGPLAEGDFQQAC